MERRKFLKNMVGGGLATGAYLSGFPFGLPAVRAHHVPGAGGKNPVLVVIFQRGGCDGLNTVVPYGDPAYAGLRGSIAVPSPAAQSSLSAIAIDDAGRGHSNFFGLNPNMAKFKEIYDAGDLAVLPAVHYPNNSHSHFSGQDFIEGAVPNQSTNGWLYRHLELQGKLNGLQGLSFGTDLSDSLRGDSPVLSITYLSDFIFHNSSGNIVERLTENTAPLYNLNPVPPTFNNTLVHNTGRLMFNNLESISGLDPDNYVPDNGAEYPVTNYGRRLKDAAQLIKLDIGVEVITVNIGGFDTHADQDGAASTGRHSIRIREYADGVSALYKDLGTWMENVIILTVTEFGRTAKVNASNGTDHGNASSWFMMGKNIQGGIHGAWPGLAPDKLDDGRYLRYTVDYRDIFGDILIKHLGHSPFELSSLIPGHTYQSVGLFA